METTEKTITEHIIDGLRKAIVELEEFRVQVALGKAEAHDAYETAKKKLHHFFHETALAITESKDKSSAALLRLKAAIETLQVQLALGKAETREVFEEQRKKIVHAIQSVEAHIEENSHIKAVVEKIQPEILKFRIKLEILRLNFELKKMDVKENFERRKKEFSLKVNELENYLRNKEQRVTAKWNHFHDDVAEAYKNVMRAFEDASSAG